MASKARATPGQLSLFDSQRFQKNKSHYDWEDGEGETDSWPNPVIESTSPSQNDSITEIIDSITPSMRDRAVNKYRAGGTARSGEYWRYSYKWHGRTKHVHIPGGCCTNPIAAARAGEVRNAIALGSSVEEILELIHSW